MNRRTFLRTASRYAVGATGLGCAVSGMGCATGAQRAGNAAGRAARKPNIIVILTDDHGFADLHCQGQVSDVRTPNIDRLAADGVRFTDAYVSAPQCCPSRAGLLTGRYQQRFGLDENTKCPLPLEETTIAARLKAAGYATGMVGKWHIEPNVESVPWAKRNPDKAPIGEKGRVDVPWEQVLPYYPQNRGFTEFFKGEMNRYWASYRLDGTSLNPAGEWLEEKGYRLDVQSDAAVAFIDRHHQDPFFLYLAYYAPHTPLTVPDHYLARFPGEMPERRRHALAMLSAINDGVGRVLDAVQRHGIDNDTLIFFLGDNGAPLKLTKVDSPVDTDPGGWDGSVNDPWIGEKGMLTEGGIRIPFVARWRGVLPEGNVCHEPIISMDIAATAVAAAGLSPAPELDGADLLPCLTGKKHGPPHEALYWRFWTQGAIRRGRWKYLQVGDHTRYLFDLQSPEHERRNLIDEHPNLADQLQKDLEAWNTTLKDPESLGSPARPADIHFYQHHMGVAP